MTRSLEIFLGCFDTRISVVLKEHWNVLPPFQTVAVRSVDSTRDLARILNAASRAGVVAVPSAQGAVIKRQDLRLALERGLFCGFDELWFLAQIGGQAEIPDDLVLTSDALRVDDRDLPRVAPVLESMPCELVLADGCGLNCITTNVAFWNELQRTADRCSQ